MDEPGFAVEPKEEKILDLEMNGWQEAYLCKVRENNMRKWPGQKSEHSILLYNDDKIMAVLKYCKWGKEKCTLPSFHLDIFYQSVLYKNKIHLFKIQDQIYLFFPET